MSSNVLPSPDQQTWLVLPGKAWVQLIKWMVALHLGEVHKSNLITLTFHVAHCPLKCQQLQLLTLAYFQIWKTDFDNDYSLNQLVTWWEICWKHLQYKIKNENNSFCCSLVYIVVNWKSFEIWKHHLGCFSIFQYFAFIV